MVVVDALELRRDGGQVGHGRAALAREEREQPPLEPGLPVLVPGDRGRQRAQAVQERGGVKYRTEQVENMRTLAAELGVKPPAAREP